MAEVWSVPSLNAQTTGHTTTAVELNQFGNSLRYLAEVDYTEFTSNVSITATTEATANTVVSASSHTFEAVPHLIEFYTSRAGAAISVAMNIVLFDGSTAIGILAFFGAVSPAAQSPVYSARRLTPTAAAHTYSVRAHMASAGTGTVDGGAGGAGNRMPGYIRITRIPT